MNSGFQEGNVVICNSGQAGSIVQIIGKGVWVLLRNGDIWVGTDHQIRLPQDQADLDACPMDIERLDNKRSVRPNFQG